MRIILFAGQAQHGKDSSGSIAKLYFEGKGKKCLTFHYADYLKFVCREYFGWDGNKDAKGRTILQQVGTELARENNPDIWVNVAIEFIKAFSIGYDYILIPDFRYPNEHINLLKAGFSTYTVWVHRQNFDNGLSPEQKNHRSETSLIDYPFNYVISVDNKMYLLVDAVKNMIETKGI